MLNEFTKIKKQILENKYSHLNGIQKEVVFSVNGPVLILAGAGSGKTTVIINRIANIIRYGNAYYSESVPDGITADTIGTNGGELMNDTDEITIESASTRIKRHSKA